MRFRKGFEAREHDALDANRFAFLDVDSQPDGLLIVAEARVKRSHPGVRIPAVAIKRDDALEVRLEFLAAEIFPGAPGQPSGS